MSSLRVLTVASNFPDKYYPTITPWSKNQVDAIKKYTDIEVEVVVPRPYSIPISFFPYYKFTLLPKRSKSDMGYNLYFPRFPYLFPKKLFFSITGDLYSFFVSSYIFKNLKRPDLIHARFSYLDGYGVLKICKKWDIPLIFDVHGNVEFGKYYFSAFLGKKQKKIINSANKILCVAQWQVNKGLKLGIPKEKLECIPLGIDINLFKPRDKEKIREEFKIKEKKIILFVGQLIERKGIEYFLIAISKLDKIHKKDCKFVIIGDGPEKINLLKLTHELNIYDDILFTGKVSINKLLKWYSLADIFVLPSLSEGRPTVINEAMASECAILATNVSGNPEQVIEGFNGYLFEPKDINTLASKLIYLLDNDKLTENMGKKSRKRVINEGWSWKSYAKKILRIYNETKKN